MCPAFAAAIAIRTPSNCSGECHLYSMLHRIIARICFSWAWAFSHPMQPKGKKEFKMTQCESFTSFGNPSHGSISDPFLVGEFLLVSLQNLPTWSEATLGNLIVHAKYAYYLGIALHQMPPRRRPRSRPPPHSHNVHVFYATNRQYGI